MPIVDPQPFAGTGGAVVAGIDVCAVDDPTVAELRRALVEHKVLVLPDQGLTPGDLVAFSRRFGPYSPVPFIDAIPGHPEVIRVAREADEATKVNFGGVWHSDFSFLEAPPAITLLYALDVPRFGGDTVWSNTELAYDALPDARREELDELVAVHTARDSYAPKMADTIGRMQSMTIRTSPEAEAETEHPLVTVHPESGRRALFFSQGYVKGIRGMEDELARPTLRFLHQHTTHVRFTMRHRWSDRDLVLWDNRSTQHFAMNDYPGQRRELLRATVAGTTPVGITTTPAPGRRAEPARPSG